MPGPGAAGGSRGGAAPPGGAPRHSSPAGGGYGGGESRPFPGENQEKGTNGYSICVFWFEPQQLQLVLFARKAIQRHDGMYYRGGGDLTKRGATFPVGTG